MTTGALILDFGGVISRFPFETHRLSERALGLPDGHLIWRDPFASEGDARGNCGAVVVDDHHCNILGALKVGLQTVHLNVHDPAASKTEALRLLEQ